MDLLNVLLIVDTIEWKQVLNFKTAYYLSLCCKKLNEKFNQKTIFEIWINKFKENGRLPSYYRVFETRFKANYRGKPFCKHCFRGIHWALQNKRKFFYSESSRRSSSICLKDTRTYIGNRMGNVCIHCFLVSKNMLPINPKIEAYFRDHNFSRKIVFLPETSNLFENFSHLFISYLELQSINPIYESLYKKEEFINCFKWNLVFTNWNWWSKPANWILFIHHLNPWITEIPLFFNKKRFAIGCEWDKLISHHRESNFGILFGKKKNYKGNGVYEQASYSIDNKPWPLDLWICEKIKVAKENFVPGKYNIGLFYAWLEKILFRFVSERLRN